MVACSSGMSIAIMSLCDSHEKEKKMKSLALIAKSGVVSLTLACASLLLAQAPPPPPQSPSNNGSVSGTISQLNYGAEMEVTSFLLNGNTLVTFPPHVGSALNSILKAGENVEVSGYSSATQSGMQRIELQTISVGGKTLSVPQPGQFTSYSSSGKVIQLNYNREGEVDGFLLNNGVFAKTPPPFSTSSYFDGFCRESSIGDWIFTPNNKRSNCARCAVDQWANDCICPTASSTTSAVERRAPKIRGQPCEVALAWLVAQWGQVLMRALSNPDVRLTIAYLIFLSSYLVFAIGRFPGTRINRTAMAIIGATLMFAFRLLTPAQAIRSIDYATLVLLFSMMLIVASLHLAGFFEWITGLVVEHVRPRHLLPSVIFTSGILSAFLVNDVVCLFMAPLILQVCRRLSKPATPYLLALATASNIGSAATITGNPQNILIGSLSGIGYRDFLRTLSPVALMGLFIAWGILHWLHPNHTAAGGTKDQPCSNQNTIQPQRFDFSSLRDTAGSRRVPRWISASRGSSPRWCFPASSPQATPGAHLQPSGLVTADPVHRAVPDHRSRRSLRNRGADALVRRPLEDTKRMDFQRRCRGILQFSKQCPGSYAA